MFCPKCGAALPNDAVFCLKCGTDIAAFKNTKNDKNESSTKVPVIAPAESKSLNCPSCNAPITPKFGEMIISCEYCGSTVALSNEGWKSIQKQTMLPIKLSDEAQVKAMVHDLMDKGILRRHLQENSKLEEMNLSLIPYWIVSVSARTSIVASDMTAQAGQIATTAALAGMMGAAMGRGMGGGMGGGFGRGMGGGFGGGRRSLSGMGGGSFAAPMVMGAMYGPGMGGRGGSTKKAQELDNNYNFPIVALKAFNEYQPKDYQFPLKDRTFFDVGKLPKGIKILNGDIGEEAAKYQAKTLVDQLQSEKAHAQYHMIQQMHTQIDTSDIELLRVPIWFVRYDHEGKKITLIIDGNSGGVINSVGL